MAIADLQSQRVTQIPERFVLGAQPTTAELLAVINKLTIVIKALQADILYLNTFHP